MVYAALVHIDASSPDVGWVESEANVADACRLFAVGLACCVAATFHHLAGRDAGLLGVSDEVVGTVAAVAPVGVGALGILAAWVGQALVDVSAATLRRRVDLLVARFALTQESAFGVHAGCVAAARAARQALVAVDAFLLVGRHLVTLLALAEVVDTLRVGRAVVVRSALHTHDVSFT